MSFITVNVLYRSWSNLSRAGGSVLGLGLVSSGRAGGLGLMDLSSVVGEALGGCTESQSITCCGGQKGRRLDVKGGGCAGWWV